MTVRDLAQAQAGHVQATATICIIGAGMAGLTLAHSLALKGLNVLLLESGSERTSAEADSLNEVDNVNGRWTGATRSRCRGIGGTSRLWGGRTIPIALAEAGPRPHIDSDAWPLSLADLEPYSSPIEKLLGLDNTSYEADLFDERGASDPDFATRWAKWPAFANCNLNTRLHKQVIANPRVTIWTNATVTGFVFTAEIGRLKSVTASHTSGSRITVDARHFVVAAGTVESTRLMLWMQRHDGHSLGRAPVLGRYFQDHINLKAAKIVRHGLRQSNELLGYRFVKSVRRSLHIELSPQAQAENRVGSAFAYISMDLEGSALGRAKKLARGIQNGNIDVSDLVDLSAHTGLVVRSLFWRYMRQRLYVPPSVDFNLEICAEQAPHWDNAITLSDQTDRYGVPLARINWAPTPEDERTLRVSVERIKAFWHRKGWDRHASLAWLPAIHDGQGSLSAAAVDYFHPSGTIRMGSDPYKSMVSGDLASHHIPNLSVLSAAVFPRAGSANPTFTLMRMALRLGDHLGKYQ
jgi:choline dehydrogenase-like flavoprotein